MNVDVNVTMPVDIVPAANDTVVEANQTSNSTEALPSQETEPTNNSTTGAAVNVTEPATAN